MYVYIHLIMYIHDVCLVYDTLKEGCSKKRSMVQLLKLSPLCTWDRHRYDMMPMSPASIAHTFILSQLLTVK